MAGRAFHTVLDHLRRLHSVAEAAQRSDRELLHAFVTHNDQDAFAAVVTRHAPLVWGVCRRILCHHQDAEDAFQATFLILARRAGSIPWRASVGGWLYKVAQRIAVRARKRSEKRRAIEQQANRNPQEKSSLSELAAIVDEELQRLPAKYREPLLLHYLQGATAEAAAMQLGLSRTTFYNRLAYGRELLRERLNRQGLSLAVPLLAASLTQEAQAAAPSLIEAALRGVTGSVPQRVAMLAGEVLGFMGVMKLKIGLALGLLLGAAAGSVAMLTPRAAKAPIAQQERPAEPTRAEKKAVPRVDRDGDPLPPGAIARLGTLRFRMESNGRELAFAPDGKTIAVASGAVWLFDAASGKAIKSIRSPYTMFGQFAFSPDGKRLLAAFQDGRLIRVKNGVMTKGGVQIWDVAGQRKTTEIELEDMLRLGWTAEGQPLVARRDKDAILLHEIETGRKRRFSAKDLAAPTFPQCAVGKKVFAATGNETGIIHVWDLSSGEERWTVKTVGVFSLYHSLVLSPDERWLASLTGDADKNTLQLWDLTNGKAKRIVAGDQQRLASAAFTRDGKTLASIGQKEVRFWYTASGTERGRLKGEGRSFNPLAVSFAPDGKTLAAMEGLGCAIHLWDVATGELKPGPEGHSTNWVQAASFSPDGKRVATSGGLDGTLRVWDAASGRQLLQLHRPNPNYAAAACTFSTDGRTLYSCWNDQLLLSDSTTGRELHVIKCENMKMHLSGDLRKAIALRGILDAGGYSGGGYSEGTANDGWVAGWDIAARKQLFRRRWAYHGIGRDLAISLDAKVLAWPNGKREPMRLEDVETGERLLTFPVLKGETQPLAFSPDGRLLISQTATDAPPPAPGGSKRTLRLWEILTASELLAFPVSIYLSAAIAFSPDGRLLALIPPQEDVLPPREEILLWDIRRGKELHRFKSYGSSVTSLAFSPDGRRLVSGLLNSTLLVWDVPQFDTKSAGKLGAEAAAKAWADLASRDAPRAFQARWTLASVPAEALDLLKQHLHPAKAADPQHLRRLFADLESEQFTVREKAQEELAKLGDLAEPALRQRLANKPTLEVRRRVQAVLEHVRGPVTRPELLQSLRAVAVLEDIGTAAARRLLEELAKGAPEARLTREAKASLERLERRPAR